MQIRSPDENERQKETHLHVQCTTLIYTVEFQRLEPTSDYQKLEKDLVAFILRVKGAIVDH